MEKFRQIVFEGLLDSKMKKEFSICFLDTSYFAARRFNPPVNKIGVIDIFMGLLFFCCVYFYPFSFFQDKILTFR